MKSKVRVILFLISVFFGLQAEASNQSSTSGNTISLASSLYRLNWNLSSTGSNNHLGDVTDRGTFKNASRTLNRENSVAATYALPTVALTFPGAGAVFNQDDVIRFKANATDNDGSVSKVEFYANGNKIGEDTSSPYEFDWTADGAGDYTIKARATDNLNGMKETTEFTISVLPGTGKIYRILPLGNSITYDNNIGDTRSESVKAAYRYKLWQLLKQDGFRFDFVGSRYSGYSFFVDANNGGMPGITKGGLLRMMQTGIDHTNKQQSPGPYLETYPADIVLLHIGTNQVNENTADVASILDEIDSYEESHQVSITVILAQIINRVTQSAVTKRYNQNLKAMAEARIANGDKIVIVNMNEGADLIYSTGVGGDMIDELHPNVSGYEKMAKIWHGAIKEVINGLNNQVPLPAAPVLASLANNTTGATLSPTLNWNASAGATSYQLQVSTNPDFSSVSFERSNLTETSASLSNLTNNTVYYWRVKAVNLTGSSAWSSIWNFTTAPSPKAQLTTVAMSSNNGITDRAKIGDVVTVSFMANVPIQETQVTIAGHTATVSPVENSTTAFIATYMMRDNDQEGSVNFSISFQDMQGNAETAVTTTTNASRVMYDRTAPVLNNVRITSNNANVSKAKVGDLVTVAFTANEPIQKPQVIVAGQEVNVSAVESSPTTFTATYTMTQNNQEGPVGFSIAFNDVTGNLGTTVTATTDNSKITFDQTAPAAVISSTINNPSNVNPIPVVVTFSESVSGLEIDDFTTTNGLISNIQTQDNKTYTADFTPTMDGTVSVTLAPNKVVDAAANNNSNSNTWSSTYDGTRPTVVLSSAAIQVTNTPFTVTFTFSEPVSGFVAEDLTLVNGIASEFTSVSSTNYTLLIMPVAQGEVTVSVRADQAADAAANGNTASAELKLIYDSIAPTAYAVMFKEEKINSANQTNVSLKVTGAETGTSYYYTISSNAGGTPVSGTGTATSAGFNISALDVSSLADGTLTITFYQQDAAGNKGLNVTAQVEKLTRSIILVTQPAKLLVPIRTTFPQLPLPATVEVTYSDNTKEHIGVTWQAGTYNGAVAGTYILTGTLTLTAGTTNQQQLPVQVLIEVEPNKVPTALSLSTTTFSPNSQPTEIIGTFTTTDADDNQHNYTLVNGQGNTDNSLFRIQDNALYLLSNAGLSGKTQFSIRVKTTDSYNQTLEQIFTLNKGEYAKAVADLKIVNAFTPNGDGTNDEWTIPELKFYNQVEIEVFDRSGVRLFHTTNPEQGWDGKDLKGQIPKGPFLYLVQVKDIDLVQKGVVTIINNK